jgi:hypothetical protein
LAAAIATCLQDPGRARALAARAQRFAAEALSADAMLRAVDAVYAAVLLEAGVAK